jgi:hypothetical protein
MIDRDKLAAALAAGGLPATPGTIASLGANVEALHGQGVARAEGRYVSRGTRQQNRETEFFVGLWPLYGHFCKLARLEPKLGEDGPFYRFAKACADLVEIETPDPKKFRQRIAIALRRSGIFAGRESSFSAL